MSQVLTYFNMNVQYRQSTFGHHQHFLHRNKDEKQLFLLYSSVRIMTLAYSETMTPCVLTVILCGNQ